MNEKMEREDIIEIDVQKLLLACLRKWWLIVLCALIVGGATLAYTYTMITPVYRAGVSFYVNNIRSDERIDYRSESNLNASSRLVRSYMSLAKSKRVLTAASKKMRNKYTAKQLNKIVSTGQNGEMEILYIYATHPDAEEAANIANVMAEVLPGIVSDLVEGTSAKVIDEAEVPERIYSPNYKRNTAMGALIGAFLAACGIVLSVLLDVRIKDERDMLSVAKLPVLGRIPEFDQLNKGSGYGYGKYGYGYGYGVKPQEAAKGGGESDASK